MPKYETFSKEELIELLKKQDRELSRKKYGLVWDSEKEPEKVVLDCQQKLPILKEDKTREIKTNDDDYNLLIEGDNYHALQVLSYTHKEKVDLIYIDPPYNTGTEEGAFYYNDRFVDKEDGYRHSKWLNFMEKRLDLAKKLLKENGSIFISIDDNEQANLKLLCDKIFADTTTKVITVKMSEASGLKMGSVKKYGVIPKLKEYLLVAKKGGVKNIHMAPVPKANWDTEYNIFLENFSREDKNKIDDISSSGNISRSDLKELDKIAQRIGLLSVAQKVKELRLTGKAKKQWLLDNAYRICQCATSTSVLKLAEEKKNHCEQDVFFVSNTNNDILYMVRATYSLESKKPRVQLIFAEDNLTQHPGDLWTDIKTTGLKGEGGVNFKNGKKPIELLKRIIKTNTNNNILILDFFAGSGSTGHAVIELNKEDMGGRRFILCTNNENQIAESICFPRIKNVICGYNKKNALGGNLKYFKTDFITNSSNKSQLKINLTRKCTDMLCVKEGIYNETITQDDFKIFMSNKQDKYLCVYYNFLENSFDDFIRELKSLEGQKIAYIFAMNDHVNTELFNEIQNITIEPIPQKILDVYYRIQKEHIKEGKQ